MDQIVSPPAERRLPGRDQTSIAPPPQTRIRELRKQRGMTLKELADMIGTTPQTVQRLETSGMTVSVEWLEKIAWAMQIGIRDLLPGNDPEPDQDAPFIALMRSEAARARRASAGRGCDAMLPFEDAGKLAEALNEWRATGQGWSKVTTAAARLAATAMRLGVEGEAEPEINRMQSNYLGPSLGELEKVFAKEQAHDARA